jgi:hypothetical protein
MFDKVYYMCYNNDPYNGGLVFPSELEENYYAPGVFVIPKIKFDKFEESYLFIAFDDGKPTELKLSRIENAYQYRVTDNKNRTYRFEIKYTSRYFYTYAGNQIQFPANTLFFILVPLDHDLLNEVCGQNGFYFLGSTKEGQ